MCPPLWTSYPVAMHDDIENRSIIIHLRSDVGTTWYLAWPFQGSYRIFNIIFPEFSLSFWWFPSIFPWVFSSKLICFSLSLLFVNYMRYECSAGGTTCNDLYAAVDLGGVVLSPQTNPGQSHGGGRGGQTTWSSRDPTAYINQKMPKIHPHGPFSLNYNLVNCVD